MLVMPDGIVFSFCEKLTWRAARDEEITSRIKRINQIDESIKNMICSENPDIESRGTQTKSGMIDGKLGSRLVYVAVSDSDSAFEWQIMHIQRLMAETKTLRECLLLVVNKNTATISDEIIPFVELPVIDFISISNEPLVMTSYINDACHLCPLCGECIKK